MGGGDSSTGPGSRPAHAEAAQERRPDGAPLDADGDGLPDAEWVASQRDNANAMGAGLQFGFVLCLFGFAGLKLDERLDTEPWLLVAGVLAGFLGGTLSLLKKFK